jgi:hypothetical protein
MGGTPEVGLRSGKFETPTPLPMRPRHLGQILVNEGSILVKNWGRFIVRSAPCAQPNSLIFMVFGWRRDPESNRGTRLCRPLHNHSAIPPRDGLSDTIGAGDEARFDTMWEFYASPTTNRGYNLRWFSLELLHAENRQRMESNGPQERL